MEASNSISKARGTNSIAHYTRHVAINMKFETYRSYAEKRGVDNRSLLQAKPQGFMNDFQKHMQ